MATLVGVALLGWSGHMHDFCHLTFSFLSSSFSSSRAQVAFVDRSWQSIYQNACFWRRMCLLGIDNVSNFRGQPTPKHFQSDLHKTYWKSEIEFRYGCRLFSESGSSDNSATDWDISPKLVQPIDFDPVKWVTSQRPKPEVDLRLYDVIIRQLKVIQGQWFWYKSKAYMQLPISD